MKAIVLDSIVERAVGSLDVSLIVEALKRYEVQSELYLNEAEAERAAVKANHYVAQEASRWSASETPLSVRCQLISEYLLAS